MHLLLALFAALHGVSAQRGPLVVFMPCDPSRAQQRLSYDGPAPVHLAFWQGPNASTAMCLDIAAFDLGENASIYGWPCGADGAGSNEQFTFTASSIASAQSTHKCLRAGLSDSAGPVRAGTPLTTATCNAGDALQALTFSGGAIVHAASSMCADLGVARGTMLAPCDKFPFSTYAFCDTSLPTDDRVADALARMTLDEKISTMTGAFGSPFVECAGAAPISSLGVGGMPNHAECLHGVAYGCAHVNGSKVCPTLFPNGQMLGASFNRSLWQGVGSVIGDEMRALQNLQGAPSGFSCWSPDLNLARDP